MAEVSVLRSNIPPTLRSGRPNEPGRCALTVSTAIRSRLTWRQAQNWVAFVDDADEDLTGMTELRDDYGDFDAMDEREHPVVRALLAKAGGPPLWKYTPAEPEAPDWQRHGAPEAFEVLEAYAAKLVTKSGLTAVGLAEKIKADVSKWRARQKTYEAAKDQLLDALADGELTLLSGFGKYEFSGREIEAKWPNDVGLDAEPTSPRQSRNKPGPKPASAMMRVLIRLEDEGRMFRTDKQAHHAVLEECGYKAEPKGWGLETFRRQRRKQEREP